MTLQPADPIRCRDQCCASIAADQIKHSGWILHPDGRYTCPECTVADAKAERQAHQAADVPYSEAP